MDQISAALESDLAMSVIGVVAFALLLLGLR